MQGRLIVFEGVEGCGKTTQLKRTEGWLCQNSLVQQAQTRHGIALYSTREPGGTPLGQEIRRLLLNPPAASHAIVIDDRAELLLYAADRAQHVQHDLKPRLASGAIVLCDRYVDSTVAYQGYGRGLSLSLIEQLNAIATQGLTSDLTLWLDVDAEVGLARTQRRGTADRIEQADLEFHRRVQHGFAELARAYPQRIVRIDAAGSEETIAQQIQIVLEQRLREWYPALTSSTTFSET